MGIGRQVADAYIDVHGDLSKFRRDLAGAREDVQKAARENADAFSDAFNKRIEKDVNGKWASVVDAMYSDKQIDWDRLIGEFDPKSLDDARKKITEFLREMRDTEHVIRDGEDEVVAGMKLENEQFDHMIGRLHEVVAGMQKREEHQRNLIGLQQELTAWQDREARAQKVRDEAEVAAHRDNEAWMARRAKTMQEAIDMNKAWARSWEGMRKNNAISGLNDDFKRLASAMNFADLEKWSKSFDSLQKARARVYEVTQAMVEQTRISQERADELHAHFAAFMDDEAAKSKAMKAALDETNRLRKAQDDYNASLSGMARNIHFSKLESDFRNLAAAMDSNDFSHFARGVDNINDMRRAVANTAGEMHRFGRMTDTEYGLILERVDSLTHHFRDNERSGTNAFTALREGASRFGAVMSRTNDLTRGLRQHLQGFAGMNVFGDMIKEGLDFIHNLDRIAVSASKTAMQLSSLASVGGTALASLFVIADDLGKTLGGIGAALPAFATGFGFMAYVGMTALQGMSLKYKKELKKWKEDMFDELNKGLKPAMDQFSTVMLPTLQRNLKETAAAEGRLFGAILEGITSSTGPDKMNLMFKRMNDAMDRTHTGVKGFVDAWARLGLVGSQYFGRFADWINKLGTNFDAFIKKAESSGQINKWIETGIQGFKDLGRVIDGTLGIFNAIVSAARAAGSGGLNAFATSLQNIAKTMQEKGFQDTLTMLFSGMRIEAGKIGAALRDLGPAIQSVMPSVKLALDALGTAVATIIGYIGDILSNPTVQRGITDFTRGVADAVGRLEPAVKPFADSLGNVLTLLGKVVVSVADIVTAFTVTLGPVLDQMSIKMQGLLKPLSDMAQNVIKALKPVADAINTDVAGPIIDAMKSDLIPAFNGFVDKAGPVLTKLVKDLGPVITNLVKVVLPGALKIATELLGPLGLVFDLFTPAVAILVGNSADGFDALAAAMRIAKLEARPEDWGILTKGFSTEAFDRSVDDTKKKLHELAYPEQMSWQDILTGALIGDLPFALTVTMMKIGQFFGEHSVDGANKIKDKFVSDWNEIFSGRADRKLTDQLIKWFPGQADFLNGIQGWEDDVFSGKWFEEARVNIVNMWNDTWKPGGGADQLDATVNKWFEESIFKPIRTGWENDMRHISEWWKTTIPESFKSDTADYGIGPAIMNWLTNDVLHLGGTTVESINKTVNDWFENNVFKPVRDGWNTAINSVTDWLKSGGDHSSSNRGDDNGRVNFPALWNDFWGGKGVFGDINKTVNDWFETNVFKPLRDAWDNAWKSVTDWLNSGGGGAESGRSDANGQEFWNSFWGGFGGMMGDIGAANIDLSNTVTTWLDTNVWKPIGDWVANLDWNQIGADLWNGFIQGLTGKDVNAWEKIGQGFTGWVEDLKNFFGIHSPSTLMFGFGSDIVTGFLNGFGDFAASVAAKWEEIKTTVSTKFQELQDGLAGAWEGFKTGWSDFWGGVGTTLSTKWEEFKTTVATKAGEIQQGVGTWASDFGNGWNGFWGDTGTNLSNAWNGFVGTVGDKSGEISNNVNTWAGDVGTNWNNFWGGVGSTLNNKWGEFTGTVSNKAGEIKGGLEGFGGDVQRNWNGFWGSVGGTLTDKWNQFSGTVSDKAGAMKGDVGGMGGSMIGYVQNAMAQMWISLSGSFNNFVSMVMYRVSDIVGWVSGLPGRISGALSGFGTLLWGAGYSIMGGLMNGLASKWSETMGWISGLAGWIAANKGPISYDRVLLVPAGEAIMTGLMNGLESKMDPLLNTLQTITALVTDSVTADLSHSAMYVAGADAAQGLADGLKANRSNVHNALGSLTAFTMPDSQVTVGGALSAVGRPTAESAPSRAFTIAEGAVQVHTQAADPWIVAGTVTDALSDAFSTNSRL